MNAVVHAWVLARAHGEEALDCHIKALEADVADIKGGSTAEGIHLAAVAGSVDLLQRRFAGLEVRHEMLWLNAWWPQRLGALEFEIRYREHPITLRLGGGGQIQVMSHPGRRPPIQARRRDQEVELQPGQQAAFRL